MRTLKRFCCGCAIYTGVQIIGYLSIVRILTTLVFSNASQFWLGNIFVVFPIINLILFLKMVKNDTVHLRRRFYLWKVISFII